MAQGMLEQRLREEGFAHAVEVDSAGTHASHREAPPDPRAVAAARARDIDIAGLRARPFMKRDFTDFDVILAMDKDNRARLAKACPAGERHKLQLVLDYAPDLREREVPDPYCGGEDDFEKALDMLELCMEGLMEELQDRLEGRVAL